MENFKGLTTDLVISSKDSNFNCEKILSIFLKLKIPLSIYPNKSIIQKDDKCWIEEGCKIVFSHIKPNEIKNVWDPLVKEFNLNCAHLHIHGYYIGCIQNYLRKSNCSLNDK